MGKLGRKGGNEVGGNEWGGQEGIFMKSKVLVGNLHESHSHSYPQLSHPSSIRKICNSYQ